MGSLLFLFRGSLAVEGPEAGSESSDRPDLVWALRSTADDSHHHLLPTPALPHPPRPTEPSTDRGAVPAWFPSRSRNARASSGRVQPHSLSTTLHPPRALPILHQSPLRSLSFFNKNYRHHRDISIPMPCSRQRWCQWFIRPQSHTTDNLEGQATCKDGRSISGLLLSCLCSGL